MTARHRTDRKRGYRRRVAEGIFTRGDKYLAGFTDETGVDRTKTLGWVKSDRHRDGLTLSEAKAERERLRVGIRRGEVVIGDRGLTVKTLIASFLERERGPIGKLAPRTLELREAQLRNHVLPLLGPNTKVADVQVQHVRRLIDKLRSQGKSGSTVRGSVAATSAIFRHAVRDLGAVGRNPVRDLERGELPSARRRTDPRYLSVEQVGSILDRMSDLFRPIGATCFWGALRISEALTLRWRDIDFEAATIHVQGTKTIGSNATIPLLPALERELRAHRQRQGRQGFARIAHDSLVFQTSNGKSPGRRNALRALQRAANRAGLVPEGAEPVGLHDLRHSLAANAFALGLTDVQVARLLRHSSPRVTLTVYAGLVEGDVVSQLGEQLAAGGFGT
jgi:integrase